MDDTTLLDRPLQGRGHRSATLSQVFKTQSRSQLLRLQQWWSGQRLHEAEASYIRRLSRFKVHARSKASDVQYRPTQREKRVKVQAKHVKHTKMKNEYEIVIQNALFQQSANSSKDLQVYQRMERANIKRKR